MGGIAVASTSSHRIDAGIESTTEQPRLEPTTEQPRLKSTADPTLIAHRGFAGENPENTRAAARAATRGDGPGRRADFVEIDVVPTAGGDVVVFHDDELAGSDGNRMGLTDTEGVVWEADTEKVTTAEVLQSGETVPRLAEMLDAIPATVGVNVELKNPGSTSLRIGEKLAGDVLETQKRIWRPFVEQVVEIVDEYDHEVLFASFYEAALAVVSERSTDPVAPILWNSIEDGLAIARAYDADAIHPPVEMVRGTPFFDDFRFGGSNIVRTMQAEGREVNVWTVKSLYQADWLAKAGVDGLIADYSTLLSDSSRSGRVPNGRAA